MTKRTLFIAAALAGFAAPALAVPTDPEIAHIVVTANAIDVEAGKLAQEKSKNPDVRKFAEQMVTDHTAVNGQAAALARKLGVVPADNDVSKGLQAGAEKSIARLKTLAGKSFDREYVGHEVAYHQAVLDAIDRTLIPSAQNAELKGLIEKVRPAIAEHLDHAKMLDAKLSGKPNKAHSKHHG